MDVYESQIDNTVDGEHSNVSPVLSCQDSNSIQDTDVAVVSPTV
jgi:hypothetical protein